MELDAAVALETQVWEALRTGDAEADAALLADDFVGLYPTGFADRGDHAGQLDQGPTVAEFALRETKLIRLSEEHVVLAYQADYRRPDAAESETMYVSSVWSRRNEQWVNVFSQDTPLDPEHHVP